MTTTTEKTKTKTNGSAIQLAPAAQVAGQLSAVREHLVTAFPEREQAIDNILTAAVAGEHVLMVGPPGTGKSALAREFARCIGGTFYEYLFSKFTTPEEFLGPFSISGLKQDKYERVLTGRLAEADVAFLDEVFKSNSASLNVMLPILNERLVFQGGRGAHIPLRIAVAASNELPTDPSLQALWDRLVLRCFVPPLQSEKNRRAVMCGTHRTDVGAPPRIDIALLDQIDLMRDVKVHESAIDLMLTMRRELEARGIVYGDRRWVKALRCVRAYALVCGSPFADTMALGILGSVLWDKAEQIGEVAALVAKVAAPHVMKARETLDEAMLAAGPALAQDAATEAITEALPKLKTAHARIAKQGREAPPGREREEIRRLAAQLAEQYNGLRETLKARYNLGGDSLSGDES